MTTVKRITDLREYASVLPYASELFGVYQPLLGWKSKRTEQRIRSGYEQDKQQLQQTLLRAFAPMVELVRGDNQQLQINLRPGVLAGGKLRSFDSLVLLKVSDDLPTFDKLEPSTWQQVVTEARIEAILQKDVVALYTPVYADPWKASLGSLGAATFARSAGGEASEARQSTQRAALDQQLRYESSVAGALLQLVREKAFATLTSMFYATRDKLEEAQQLIARANAEDGTEALLGLETLDPGDREHIRNVALSPIAVVHLFRQYFFELDTFLGTPVSHVWLSPGSTVELIEVHTRKTIVEKTLEQSLETITQAETTTTTQDEISEAVKQDNQQDIKFGASVQASYASIQATTSFDMTNSQKMAREVTHKQIRQKTEKLSSEIRKSFKSTFRTVTETTDSTSIKHTMGNSTKELLNYELRRKMRQVGVQVQDVGTFLCWQTYVDDPGRDLGVAKLVHIAKPADLDGLPHPEEIPALQPFQEEKTVTIPFISVANNADNKDEVYVDGVEVDNTEWFGDEEKIQADFEMKFVCPRVDHTLTHVDFDAMGRPISASVGNTLPSDGSFVLHLDSADFQGQNSVQVKLVLHWAPKQSANDAVAAKNAENLAAYKEAERAAHQKAYVETVKERVTLASKIRTRDADELREEERIVVYRRLIQDMLLAGIEMPDDRTRHVTAELLDSIFDIDKLLYFVAPEWWRPRLHRSGQQMQPTPPRPRFDVANLATAETAVLHRGLAKRFGAAEVNSPPSPMSASTVGWGGTHDAQRDNYLITEDSEPAKLGSSLGWLLQLDGDNMRNAFLNAPWVKAVIPIRPGRERAAINWLKGVEGMNGITDDVIYHSSNPEEKDVNGQPLDGQPLIDVLMDLGEKVRRKYREGIDTGKYPKQDEVSDPALVDDASTVTATPIDRVYEHGFYPLAGSFRYDVSKNYEIFDQWLEILPTDQIVPVEVKYDPKTGRQL
jgi:hypothetical protein